MKKHLLFRFLFLILSFIPLAYLMFIGKAERLKGILYDIENFIGLREFVFSVFIIGSCIIGIETLFLIIKKKKKKYFTNVFLLVFFCILYFVAVSNDVFYRKEVPTPTQVIHPTLIIASEGEILNFDLELNDIAWNYNSKLDNEGNRTSFVVDGQNIFMPFESGSLINFDINTGQVIWRQQIYGQKEEWFVSSDGEVNVDGLTPLLMSKPFVDKKNLVIASHGHPNTTIPFLYSFDKKIGTLNWKSNLPTHYNTFTPIKYKGNSFDYYFINSAVYLIKYGANSGSKISYGMFERNDEQIKKYQKNQFDFPIYAQMQTDGKNLFIGDEKGKFYCLPLTRDANVVNNDISETNNTLQNSSVFKWIFSDKDYPYQNNGTTFLEGNNLYGCLNNGSSTESMIVELAIEEGSLNWKKIIKGNVLSWDLVENRIIGCTDSFIFYIDIENEIYTEANIKNKPLSNIEQLNNEQFIYLTESGIELFDIKIKKTKIIFEKRFNNDSYNNIQIKYFSNK